MGCGKSFLIRKGRRGSPTTSYTIGNLFWVWGDR